MSEPSGGLLDLLAIFFANDHQTLRAIGRGQETGRASRSTAHQVTSTPAPHRSGHLTAARIETSVAYLRRMDNRSAKAIALIDLSLDAALPVADELDVAPGPELMDGEAPEADLPGAAKPGALVAVPA